MEELLKVFTCSLIYYMITYYHSEGKYHDETFMQTKIYIILQLHVKRNEFMMYYTPCIESVVNKITLGVAGCYKVNKIRQDTKSHMKSFYKTVSISSKPQSFYESERKEFCIFAIFGY